MLVTECWDYDNKDFEYHYIGIKKKNASHDMVRIKGIYVPRGWKIFSAHKSKIVSIKKCLTCKWGLKQVLGRCKRTTSFKGF